MSNRLPTIYDVAKRARVSAATVSRVLNEPSRVQSDKRRQVIDAITELKFVPRAEAVAHARTQYKKIAVIAPFFAQPSFMQRLRGISSILQGRHYELVVYAIETMKELEEYVDMLASGKRVDGVIILCLNLREETLDLLRSIALPVCFVEADIDGFDSVLVDNYRGGRMAAEFLYGQGYRNPAFIGESTRLASAIPVSDLRLQGFTDYFMEKGIAIHGENVWMSPFEEKRVDEGILETVFRGNRPDSVFAANDMIAVRLIRIASQHGISVPKELGLVGFDDIDIAEYLNLSTISQSLDESGRLAAEMILDRLRDPSRDSRKVLAPLYLIKRSSGEK